ncbi:MAG: hypothetical protein HY560_03855 [Gemmatimonadetes bacterium]|nr:hypothetical protein [Gemmatimonadota bacterium]
MFKLALLTQWKWSRLVLLPGVVAAFSIPVLSVREAGPVIEAGGDPIWRTQEMLRSVEAWSVLYPLLAAALAVAVALTAWGPDHRGQHVYALSLPVPRWHYVLLRLGAGAVLLTAPVVAVGLGALLATVAATLPPGTHAYPLALSLRFGLALLVAYAVFFAICAGTTRTAGIVLSVLAALVVADVLLSAAGAPVDVLGSVGAAMFRWPGPLQIFTGRWMLIDV